MTNITSILMELIKSAVLAEPLAKGFNEPTEQMISELYSLSKFHDIANIVGSALIDNGFVKSADMREKFQKEIMLSIYRERQISTALSTIVEAFRQAKIQFIPLKGSVIRPLYAKPWLRTSCDIDVLVRESDLDLAVKTLTEKYGYTTKGKVDYHDISLYSASGVHLELHYNIKEVNDKMDAVLDRVWQHSAPLCDGGFEFRQSPEFLLFHVIAHTAHHFRTGGCGIRPFIDIYLLRKNGGYDEEVLSSLCAEAGVEAFRQGVEELVSMWFESATPVDRAANMEEFIFSGGTYGTLEQCVLASQTSSGGKTNYLMKRIFLSYEHMKIRYPVLKKHRWLTPIYEVRRWFELLFSKRLSVAVKQYERSNSITQEESEKTIELFESLGLK